MIKCVQKEGIITTTTIFVLRPVSFKALYEFVDLHQDGESYGSGKCSRLFTQKHLLPALYYTSQNFASPRDIFLYGRGGSKNIRFVKLN